MENTQRSWLIDRGAAALPLAIPALAGLAYLALFDAPRSFLYVNAGALLAAMLWASFGRLPSGEKSVRIVLCALVALLALPLITGPNVEGIARWLPLGGLNLHVGMAVIPLIAVLAARETKFANITVITAALITIAQPDPASALAVLMAAIGISLARRHPNRLAYMLCALPLLGAATFMANLPPQEFVERILTDLFLRSPASAALLALSLAACVALILRHPGADKATRFALAGALAGFSLASLVGDYPTPLIGYGAASIIGFGLALPALRMQP